MLENLDEVDPATGFTGNLIVLSVEMEVDAWKLIEKTADEALSRYPTTLKEDVEILQRDK